MRLLACAPWPKYKCIKAGKSQYPQAMDFAKSLKHTFLRSPLVPGFCPLYGFVSTRCTVMPDMSEAAQVLRRPACLYRSSEITEVDPYAALKAGRRCKEFSEITNYSALILVDILVDILTLPTQQLMI